MGNTKLQSNNVISYPRFIKNATCKEDLFEGQSHSKIANQIAQLLQQTESNNVIGIDGGWGSGKSNLVELIKKRLEDNDNTKGIFHFFIYDAWGYQTDFQRRTILENLTAFLVNHKPNPILKGDKWNGKLRQLFSRKRSVGTKTVKELSAITKIASVIALVSPFLVPLLTITDNLCINLGISTIIFLIAISIIYKMQIKNMIKYGQDTSLKNVVNELFLSYLDYTNKESNIEEAIKFETIYDEEPSSRDFREWIKDIDTDISSQKLVIVFDNMDRLPSQKVQELWAAIHTFFADIKYNNIRVIVPFDREHIKSAFKSEDIEYKEGEKKCFGDDFINKTFSVVYRVSPPTMSNWKDYFNTQWSYAFGCNSDSSVTQIYDMLTKEQTPRKIIAFINEFVSIKQLLSGDEVPDKYIALFIFGKSKIVQSPDTEILRPTYLDSLNFLYQNDKDLPKYISALYYQLPPDKALDIIYTENLKQALDNKDDKQIELIKGLSIFYLLLDNAITQVSNIPNVVIALNKCFGKDYNREIQRIWNCVYTKMQPGRQEDTLQEYQEVLVQKIALKEEYLKKIINDFVTSQHFNAVEYCKSIDGLAQLEGIEPYIYLTEKEVEPQMFVEFLEQAKNNYKQYKIVCEKEKLDGYLSSLTIEQLKQLKVIPYICKDYDLTSYVKLLKTTIDANVYNKDNIKILYTRLKEIEHPIDKKISESDIYNLFCKTEEDDEFYYDFICMRFSCLGNFHSSYQAKFTTALNKTDDEFVLKVAERVEFYMSLEDILINADKMNYPLYKAVAKRITENESGISKLNILNTLKKYDSIINNLKIEPFSLISRLNGGDVNTITTSNISTIPINFFNDISIINNKLTQHCQSKAAEYLKSISKEDWKKSIVSGNNNYKLFSVIKPKSQTCFDAIKELLVEYVKGTQNTLTEVRYNTIISIEISRKRSFITTFKNVRDCFCNGSAIMTHALFTFFAKWLLEYARLEERQSSLRTIFTHSILDEPDNIQLILNNQEKMIQIINKAGEEGKDFKDKIEALLKNGNKKNTVLVEFAKRIGCDIQDDSMSEVLLA